MREPAIAVKAEWVRSAVNLTVASFGTCLSVVPCFMARFSKADTAWRRGIRGDSLWGSARQSKLKPTHRYLHPLTGETLSLNLATRLTTTGLEPDCCDHYT